jgi:hypothetical protein
MSIGRHPTTKGVYHTASHTVRLQPNNKTLRPTFFPVFVLKTGKKVGRKGVFHLFFMI